MSFAVFVGDPSVVHESDDYMQWKDDTGSHNDPYVYTNIEDVPQSHDSLFFDIPPLEIHVPSIKVSDIRSMLYRAENTGESISIITEQKPRGDVSKDGVNVIEIGVPVGKSLENMLMSRYGIDRRNAHVIVSKYGSVKKNATLNEKVNAMKACRVIAQQVSFVSGSTTVTKKHYRHTYNPYQGDIPPWDLTDAINDGDIFSACQHVAILLRQKKSSPQSLYMQLCGYYNKVISPTTPWFFTLSQKMMNKDKAIEVLSQYSYSVMESDKVSSRYHVMCFVADLASCFIKRKVR